MTRIKGDLFDSFNVEKIVLAFCVYLITQDDLTDKVNKFADEFQKWFIQNNPFNQNDEMRRKEAELNTNAMVLELDNYIQQNDLNRLFEGILKK